MLFRLYEGNKRFDVVAGEFEHGSIGGLVGVRLDPPNKPGEPRVQEQNDRERENGPPVTQPAKATRAPRFLPILGLVHERPGILFRRPNRAASAALDPVGAIGCMQVSAGSQLVAVQVTLIRVAIRSSPRKGLERFFTTGSQRGIQTKHAECLRLILAA